MRIVSAVSEFGGGHAWLHIGTPPTDDMRIVVEREGERNCFLGPQGWQNQPEGALPIAVSEPSQKNALLLGPNIVDHIRDGDFVTISVPSTGFSASDFWPPIPISGRKSQGDGMVGSTQSESQRPGQKQAESPALKTTMQRPSAGTVTGAGAAVATPPVGIDTSGSEIDADPATSRIRRLWWGASAAALLVAIAAWLYLPENPLSELAKATQTISDMGHDIVAQLPGMNTRDPAYWTGVLRDPASTPEALFEAAVETRGNMETRGISQEMLYQSALRGNNQAVREYSQLYDPTISETNGWEGRKNARTALEFYSKLRDGGDQSAATSIQRVCDFLKPDIYVNADARTAFDDHCSQP